MEVGMLHPVFVYVVAALFGACAGSFANVAIYRWPRGLSASKPRSRCPHCETPIAGWNNIPILTWLLLRGRSRCCGKPIRARYVVVEIIGALLAITCAELWIVQAEPSALARFSIIEACVYFVFCMGLVIATFVDLEWMEIPDEVSLPIAALGLATSTLRVWPGPVQSALGAGFGFLLVYLLFIWLYETAMNRRGMGEGDAKLLLMIGAFLGVQGVIFSLVAGSFQGLIYTAIAKITGLQLTPKPPERRDFDPDPEAIAASDTDNRIKIPFGPFLALGALEHLFFGDTLIALWFRLLGG